MRKSLSVLCLILLALGLLAKPAAASESATPRPDALAGSCSAGEAAVAVASPVPLGPPAWLDAAGCCPRTCNVNSDCDASCGAGFGQCKFLGTCCSFCLCSLGGSLQTALSSPPQP